MSKVVIHEITKCKECPYFYFKSSIGNFCYKAHKVIGNPNRLDDDCPLPDKAKYAQSIVLPIAAAALKAARS
jgi:hypothetical protein